MLAAIEFFADRYAHKLFDAIEKVAPRIAAASLEEGVIARAMPMGDILGFAPQCCLTSAEADEIATKTARAVKSVFGA